MGQGCNAVDGMWKGHGVARWQAPATASGFCCVFLRATGRRGFMCKWPWWRLRVHLFKANSDKANPEPDRSDRSAPAAIAKGIPSLAARDHPWQEKNFAALPIGPAGRLSCAPSRCRPTHQRAPCGPCQGLRPRAPGRHGTRNNRPALGVFRRDEGGLLRSSGSTSATDPRQRSMLKSATDEPFRRAYSWA